MRTLVNRVADRLLERVAPRAEAQACGWTSYCGCYSGYIYYFNTCSGNCQARWYAGCP
ncbi:hypothetical protein Aph01nite_35210 [Acrocarpospora phusangensis]|uniref:Uncharacterized protein n=1 Tax=Acrocarpospora phusangensis TaxID=1070424 RepID=A0A919QAG0_9ACTN|nr:hypothetical protein [Acrocarpospora phusangensis]GIH25211.1 hypothetical protein Aph01nite_35210 [Acrocarpospora phusangensis]